MYTNTELCKEVNNGNKREAQLLLRWPIVLRMTIDELINDHLDNN